jgi:sugar (pentulose or hexulose) kinase
MRSGEKILAVDLGTTYFKVCRFDSAEQLEATHTIPTPVVDTNCRREVPVHNFRESLAGAIRLAASTNGTRENIVALSFASQANSFALFDRRDEPLTPFVLWSDLRAMGLNSSFYEFASRDEFRDRTGVAQLNHLFVPPKLEWFQRFSTEIHSKTCRLAFIGDYFTWWLTGKWCTEAGTAGLSGLVDIRRLNWWQEACAAAEIPLRWLGEVVRAGTDIGPVRPDTAAELNLPHDCRVIIGCLDQYAGAIGADNVSPGNVSETTGTVLATVRCSGRLLDSPAREIYQGPAFRDGLYYQMVFSELSAGLLARYRNHFATGMTYRELDALAESVPPGARGLRLRADAFYRDPSDFFANRQSFHDRADDVRAILEGVAAELCRQVHLICGDDLPRVVRATGGAAKSKVWLEIKSQALGIPVVAVESDEPTALGAARLANKAIRISTKSI